MSNYQNGTIYKIVCKDSSITDCYVGSTTNNSKRKSTHKSACNNDGNKKYNYPVYRFIRDNGGWENWEFVLLEDYPCNKKKQLNIRERYWFEKLNATLNDRYPERRNRKETLNAYRSKTETKEHYKEYYNRPEIKEHRKEYEKQYYNRPEIKEHRKEKNKEYYNIPENKQRIKEQQKEYRNRPENKQYMKEYHRLKYTCNACNKELTLINKNRHEKSQKHIGNLEKLKSQI